MENYKVEQLKARLALRNLIIDKLLIGVLILIVGFRLNVLLEEYKTTLKISEKTINQKSLSLSEAYESSVHLYSSLTAFIHKQDATKIQDWKNKHLENIGPTVNTINRNSLYLSKNIENQLQLILHVHTGIKEKEFEYIQDCQDMFYWMHGVVENNISYELGLTKTRNNELDKLTEGIEDKINQKAILLLNESCQYYKETYNK